MKPTLPKYKWAFRETDPDNNRKIADALHQELGLSPFLLRILVSREIDTPEKIQPFLNPSASGILPPEAIPNLEQAKDRLVKACKNAEQILVHGDYDVDGVVGAVILHKTLKDLGCKSRIFLPKRDEDGFGLSIKAVELAQNAGIGLIVTVDCGISSTESVQAATEAGIEVIITDHHTIPDSPPTGVVLVHPELDGDYPGGKIAGATVGFKLALALVEAMGRDPLETMDRFLPMVAIATVADVCPLTGENRHITKLGLAGIPSTEIPGLKVLYEGTRRDGSGDFVSARDVGFGMAPLLNAAGRMGDPVNASKLLLAKDSDNAWRHFRTLENLNSRRKRTITQVVRRLMQLPEVAWTKMDAGVLAVMDQDCTAGLAGLAAMRLAEQTGRPTCVLAPSGTGDELVYRGSMRTSGGENLIELMQPVTQFTDRLGGHPGAIGLTVLPGNLKKFIKACTEIEWSPSPKSKTLDFALESPLINPEDVLELDALRPWGMGNPEPEFAFGPVKIEKLRAVGKELEHMQFRFVSNDGNVVKGIGFSMAQYFEGGNIRGQRFLTAGHFMINNWMGNQSVEFQVSDIDYVK